MVSNSAPITANAATPKVLGVGKTFTVKKTTKVSGLSKAEKKIVKVTVNKKKKTVTVKGLKAGKASFKIGKKAYTVKVGATKITKKTVNTSMTAGETKTLSVNAVNGKGDTIQFTSSKKGVVKVNKASVKATTKKVAATKVTAVAAGTAKITAKSKYTGKSATFTITVKAADTPATQPPTVATTPAVTTATATPGVATTPAVQTTAPAGTDAAATENPDATKDPNATQNPDATKNPDATGAPSESQAPSATDDANTTPAPEATDVPTKPEAATTGAITVTTNATGSSINVLSGTAVVASGTAAQGTFVSEKLENGTYVVEVSKDGFKTATETVVVNGDVAITVTLEQTTEFVASQIGRKTIMVTGENLTSVVEDYTITRGKSTITASEVTVSDDKKTAKITLASSSMSADIYTVAFGENTSSFTAEVEVIDSIVIVGTDLVVNPGYDGNSLTGEAGATIAYKVLNQFGERMADDGTDVAVSATCTLGEADITGNEAKRTADGKVTVTVENGVIGTTKGSLVLVDTKSGKSAAATVTLSSASAVASVKVAGIYNTSTSKETSITTGISNANISNYGILLKAYDQYGNETTTFNGASTGGNVTVTVAGTSNITIAAADYVSSSGDLVTIDDESYIFLPFSLKSGSETTEGSSVITIVGNSIGLLATVNVDVKQATSVVDFEVKPVDTLYLGSKTEMEYKAIDSEGNAVTDFNTLNTSSLGLNSDFTWERQSDGSAKLYLTPSSGNTVTSSQASSLASGKTPVTTTLNTSLGSNVHVTTIKVYPKKVCTKIIGLKDTAAKAAVLGDTISYKQSDFVIEDQYQNTMTDAEVAADTDSYIFFYSEDDTDAFDEDYTSLGASGADSEQISSDSDNPVFSATAATAADDAGSETVTFVLLSAAATTNVQTALGNKKAGSDCTITLKSTTIENVTNFAITALPTLYVDKESVATTNVSAKNSVNVPVIVTGKYGNLTVNISDSDYNVISTSDMLTITSGKLSVVGTGDLGTDVTSKDETIEIAIKNKEGSVVSTNVTISNELPKVTSVTKKNAGQLQVAAIDLKIGSANPTLEYADIVTLLDVTDQYDGKSTAFAGDIVAPRVLFTNIPDEFTVANNNTNRATLTPAATAEAGKSYTVTVSLTYPSGVTFTDTIVIPVVDTTP